MLGGGAIFSIGHLNHQVTTSSKAMQMDNLGNDLKEGVVLSIELPPCMTTQKVFSPLSIIVLKDNSHLHLWKGKDVTISHTIHWLGEVINSFCFLYDLLFLQAIFLLLFVTFLFNCIIHQSFCICNNL